MDVPVLVERRDSVLSITLARPERRNAITVAMYAALADAIEGAADDPSIRLITLEGQGEDFTAGNDLGDFLQAMPQPGDGQDIPVWRLLRALAKNQVPIIAAVHGNAVGIGTTMLFHCDFVLAEEGSRFVMPFVDLGLVPEAASSLIFPRLAGRRRAARYLLLGEPFGVAEAMDIGLASHAVPQGRIADRRWTPLSRRCSPSRPKRCARPRRCFAAKIRRKSSIAWSWKTAISPSGFSPTRSRQAITAFFAARAKAPAA